MRGPHAGVRERPQAQQGASLSRHARRDTHRPRPCLALPPQPPAHQRNQAAADQFENQKMQLCDPIAPRAPGPRAWAPRVPGAQQTSHSCMGWNREADHVPAACELLQTIGSPGAWNQRAEACSSSLSPPTSAPGRVGRLGRDRAGEPVSLGKGRELGLCLGGRLGGRLGGPDWGPGPGKPVALSRHGQLKQSPIADPIAHRSAPLGEGC